jgi:DNA polymerase-3 subunit chi
MVETLFYHLQRRPLEHVLPTLLEKTLDRGWKAVVQAVTPERIAALDAHLWTFSEESFLPHVADGEPATEDDPIVLTVEEGNPNGADVRFLVEGARLPQDASGYSRLIVIFDGNDDEALALAREQWREARAAGHDATYWQQNEDGRWEKKA